MHMVAYFFLLCVVLDNISLLCYKNRERFMTAQAKRKQKKKKKEIFISISQIMT